jgi:hypothetical protein
MAVITRFFSDVTAPASGLEIPDILGGVPNVDSGYVQQIIISATSGGGSTIRVEVRYEKGDSSRENLIYLYEDGPMPEFVDSCINGPFSLNSPNPVEDLSLYIEPEVSGTFEIRIDIDLDRWRTTI